MYVCMYVCIITIITIIARVCSKPSRDTVLAARRAERQPAAPPSWDEPGKSFKSRKVGRYRRGKEARLREMIPVGRAILQR